MPCSCCSLSPATGRVKGSQGVLEDAFRGGMGNPGVTLQGAFGSSIWVGKTRCSPSGWRCTLLPCAGITG